MARPYRIQFAGACYHVQIRFSSDARAFRGEADYARFISMLADAAMKHEVVVYAFCLLKREVELVVQTPWANLSLFLQGLQTGYAQYHHRKYRFEGALVRDRFRSKVVEAPLCLLALTRSVHVRAIQTSTARRLNKAGRRKWLTAYKWSSYRTHIGQGKPLAMIDTRGIQSAFKEPLAARAKAYKAYCEECLGASDKAFAQLMKASPIALGSDAFIAKLKQQHTSFVRGRKPAHFQVYGRRKKGLSATKILQVLARELDVDKQVFLEQRKRVMYRPIASYILYRFGNLSQDEIAKVLKLNTGAAVSVQMKRIQQVLKDDKKLAAQVSRIEKALRA
ncbi:MAG: hypothetical protein VCG02_01725 [Verrucomicrobiota bacterium]